MKALYFVLVALATVWLIGLAAMVYYELTELFSKKDNITSKIKWNKWFTLRKK